MTFVKFSVISVISGIRRFRGIDLANYIRFLLSNSTRIDSYKYLESLETAAELIVYTEEHIRKLLIYFNTKRYFHFKNISYPLNIDCGWLFQVNH